MDEPATEADRRGFLSRISTVAMAGGLVAGYGAFGAIAARFLYPQRGRKTAWVFVGEADRFRVGDTLRFQTPIGQTVTITRRNDGAGVDAFLALSTTCPHLGCQVHWEQQNNRFFCPCHNGVFDASGKATEGPPAVAQQTLPQFPLDLVNGLLFIQVPVEVTG